MLLTMNSDESRKRPTQLARQHRRRWAADVLDQTLALAPGELGVAGIRDALVPADTAPVSESASGGPIDEPGEIVDRGLETGLGLLLLEEHL